MCRPALGRTDTDREHLGETLKHITWSIHYESRPHNLHAVIGWGLNTHCPKAEMSQTWQNNKKIRNYRERAESADKYAATYF